MKLSELKSILEFKFDFADPTIFATFYIEIDDILPTYAKQIDVISITPHYIHCDFYKFIKQHKISIKEYLYKVYYTDWASYYFTGIFEEDDVECIAYFIEHDMDNFLRGDY